MLWKVAWDEAAMVEGFPAQVGSGSGVLLGMMRSKEKANMTAYMIKGGPVNTYGVRGLIELTNLVGYYALLAFNINAFGVDLPAEISAAPLPI